MESLTQVRVKLGERKAALLKLASAEELDETEAERFETLRGEVENLTRREAALLAAGADDEPEPVAEGDSASSDALEFAALVAAADAGDVVDHVVFKQRVAGATRELMDEVKAPHNVIPFELLFAGGIEEFAASTTTSAGDGSTKAPTIAQVFPTPLGEMFGIARPMLEVGLRTQPVVTAPSAGPSAYTAVGTAASDETVTIGATNLSPNRLQVQATVGRDELSTFAGLMGDVERVLRDALAAGLDGRATAALFAAGTAPTATTDVATFATGLQAVTDCLDGIYAGSVMDLRVLLGVATARLFERVYRSDEDAMTLADAIRAKTETLMASAHVAAPASDDQEALVSRGGRVATVQAVWGPGVEVLDDPYSLSSEGQRRITACVMTDVEVVRAAQYERLSFHLA